LGIVGESGCGKSTLVKSILFLEPPTDGAVQFQGKTIRPGDAQQLRRHLQMVCQDPYTSLPPRMKVRDIIAEPLRIHEIGDETANDQKVERLMQEVGLNPARAGQYPFQF